MKIDTGINKTLFMGVYSPPRSGSTIVASFFNSIDDCAFLGEPWEANTSRKIPTRYGPIELIEDAWNYGAVIHQFGIDNKLKMIGYKEVYSPNFMDKFDYVFDADMEALDFVVLLFRNPLRVFSSITELGRDGLKAGEVNQAYKYFYNISKTAKRAYVIVYEEFIRNPVGYINSIFPFTISGNVVLRPNEVQGGDPLAKRSTSIKDTDSRKPYSRGGEISEAMEVYKKLTNG